MSWLPLYHDMGLIGMLDDPDDDGHRPRARRARRTSSPRRRAGRSGSRTSTRTITAGPNFSYALVGPRAAPRSSDLDLSPWRLALNGAEPIDPAAVEDLLAAGAAARARASARRSAPTAWPRPRSAITFPDAGQGHDVDTVDRRVLETDRYAAPPSTRRTDGARRLPFLGQAIARPRAAGRRPGTGAPAAATARPASSRSAARR